MPGLDPGIHVLISARKTWMAGTSPAMTARRPFPLGHRTDSTVKQRKGVRPRSRGTGRPSFAKSSALIGNKGRRESRVHAAPAVSCAMCAKKRTRAYRSSGGIPAFPARWVTAYFVLSPVNGFLATVARERHASHELSASTAAPGPHDFAVRVRRQRQLRHSRPPHLTARS